MIIYETEDFMVLFLFASDVPKDVILQMQIIKPHPSKFLRFSLNDKKNTFLII